MPGTFEEAYQASEDMLDTGTDTVAENTGADEENGMQPDNEDANQVMLEQQSILDEATQAAEAAAQAASDKDAQLSQALGEIDALREQTSNMQSVIDELSRRNEESITEDVLTPPEIDFNALAFADEKTVKAAQAKYAQDMAEYSRKTFMKELEPVFEQAAKAKYNEEKAETVEFLASLPQFNGIKEMMPRIDAIIEKNKWLSSDNIPMDERIVSAYTIARGADSMNAPPPAAPKEPTQEELMNYYNTNADFREAVERQRIEAIKEGQQVPPFSASGGAANIALNIKDKPKDFEESLERSRKGFFN